MTEARANTTIKQQEDQRTSDGHRSTGADMTEQELKLQKEEHDELRLERKLEALASRKATVATERKDPKETHAMVLACEVATDIRNLG
jgi:hypothetical protein